MRHKWIVEVLDDIYEYARVHKLDATAEQMAAAKVHAEAECKADLAWLLQANCKGKI